MLTLTLISCHSNRSHAIFQHTTFKLFLFLTERADSGSTIPLFISIFEGGILIFHSNLCTIYKELTTLIFETEETLSTLPLGTLEVVYDGKYEKWYHYHDGQLDYIKKSNRSLAEQLAYKKYLSDSLNNLIAEKESLDTYFQKYDSILKQNDKPRKNSKCYNKLLSDYLQDECEYNE